MKLKNRHQILTKKIQETSRKKYAYSIDVSYPELFDDINYISLEIVNNLRRISLDIG